MKFKWLSVGEAEEFKQWARQNYEPFSPIKGIWHPVVQQECVDINFERVVLTNEEVRLNDQE